MSSNRVERSLFPAAAGPSLPAATAPGPSAAVERSGGDGPGAIVWQDPADAPAPASPAEAAAAAHWMRWGKGRGLASEALLFAALAGTAPRAGDWHGATPPSCRAEIYRCLRLIADLPWARRGLDPLAAAYPAWAALRQAWDELTAAMIADVGPTWPLVDLSSGRWPDTTRTEALLRKTLQQAGIQV